MLEVNEVHTYYGDSYVLQGVSLRVDQGAIVALLGRNGVGKTTVVRSIIGFTPPRRGRVFFDGEEITRLPPYEIARKGIGLLPQGRRVFGSLNVQENLAVAAKKPAAGRGWELKDILDLFPRLRERFLLRAKNLSGGEQQMLASGRALVGNPRLVLMDEPTEGLAPLYVRELRRVLTRLKEQGTAVLLVEQNLPFALGLADYVYVMSKGTIVYESPPAALASNEEVKSRYLGV